MELVRKVVKNPEKTEEALLRSAEAYAIVKKVSVEREYVAQCLVDLDAYSSQTFEHSVNAAAIFCQEMIRSGRYSKEQIEDWTAAALVHDVGKLATPLHVLHKRERLTDEELAVMMEHSISSYRVIQKRGFPKLAAFCAVGHHVGAFSMRDDNFQDAVKSRFSWEKSYPNGEVEKILTILAPENPEERRTLGLFSLIDSVEAQASARRSYKEATTWGEYSTLEEFNSDLEKIGDIRTMPLSIQRNIMSDEKKHMLTKQTASVIFDEEFRRNVELSMSVGMPQKLRTELGKIMHTLEAPVFSEDKLKEIEAAPEVGVEFANCNANEQNIGHERHSCEGVATSVRFKSAPGTAPSGEYVVVKLFDAPEFGTHRSDMGFDASVLSISYENGETENFLAVKLPAYFNTKDLGKGKASKEQVERFMRNVSVVETAGAPENLRVEEIGGRYSVEFDEASVRLTSEPAKAANFADFDDFD